MSGEDDAHLIERTVATEQVWRGKFLDVRRATIALPDGQQVGREYIVHPGAVMMVPILDDGRLVMERQFRFPMERVMLEFPAGKIDSGEHPFDCARRELAEETGYTAREWARAGVLHNAIAYACAVCEGGTIEIHDLPEAVLRATSAAAAASTSPGGEREEGAAETAAPLCAEAQLLLQYLRASRWNISAVAHQMGLSRMTVYRRMKRWGIEARR